MYGLLRENGRNIPALMVVSPSTLERLAASPSATSRTSTSPDRTRPSRSAGGSRRCASAARPSTMGAGRSSRAGVEAEAWQRRGRRSSRLQSRRAASARRRSRRTWRRPSRSARSSSVLLIDADTVTGHVTTSLGVEAGPHRRRQLASTSSMAGRAETLTDIASTHPSGMRVVALLLEPDADRASSSRRASPTRSAAARRGCDFVIVDLHPSYSPLNQAIFERADRILVPVTPDVPAIRAAVQLSRHRRRSSGIRERSRSSSTGPTAACRSPTWNGPSACPRWRSIRSGGLLFVRAANEGRTVIEMFPKEKISEDFEALADRLLGTSGRGPRRQERLRAVQPTQGRGPSLARAVPSRRVPHQRERSCQLVPPSDAPGRRWCARRSVDRPARSRAGRTG